eukprot:7351736-Karenia_brevis.AAC.1
MGLPNASESVCASHPEDIHDATYVAAAATSLKVPRPVPPSQSGSMTWLHSASVSGTPAKTSAACLRAVLARLRAPAVKRGGRMARS